MADHYYNCTYISNGVACDFTEPMPWIGLYVAMASLVCTVAMAGDIIRSFTWNFWIPSQLFVLNAAFLAVLGIATKIPNDVTTEMPGRLDQIAKVTGVLLICVSMNHAMPSLSVMDGGTLLSNMIALGILVLSTTVNICFQVYTKLISPKYVFWNVLATVIMLLMYLMLISHSLTATAIKEIQEKSYNSKNKELLSEVESGESLIIPMERLREYVMKYWLMALTSSPDYVLLSSSLSSANVTVQFLLSLLLPLCVMSVKRLTCKEGENSCMNSDYKASIIFILIVQTIAAFIGSLSSLTRCVPWSPMDSLETFKWKPLIEKYRLQKLREWKEDPLPFHVKSKAATAVVLHAKDLALGFLILFQRLMATLTMAYLFIVFYGFVVPFTLSLLALRRSSDEVEEEYLSGYVLTPEGGGNAKATAKRWKNYPEKNWIRSGQRRQPKHLFDLLTNKNLPQQGRLGLADGVETMASEDRLLQGSWSLQLTTSVVQALFRGSDHDHSSKKLTKAIDEGFQYWILVDKNHAKVSDQALKAAKMVRERLMVGGKWLDVRLAWMPGQTAWGVVHDLEVCATGYVRRYENVDRAEWPLRAVAAKSMCRITQAMMAYWTIGFTFDELEAEVVGLMERCLAGLSLAIFYECSKGSYGSREQHVGVAASFLGETEEILKLLEAGDRVAATP